MYLQPLYFGTCTFGTWLKPAASLVQTDYVQSARLQLPYAHLWGLACGSSISTGNASVKLPGSRRPYWPASGSPASSSLITPCTRRPSASDASCPERRSLPLSLCHLKPCGRVRAQEPSIPAKWRPTSRFPRSTNLPTCSSVRFVANSQSCSSLAATPDRPSGGRFLPSTSCTSKYENKVAFYAVYILEAHPSDVWQMQSNIKDKVVFASPKNEEERSAVAESCVRNLGIKFPALLDGFDNTTEQAYTGWPDRLYLIDRFGEGGLQEPPRSLRIQARRPEERSEQAAELKRESPS